MDHLPGQDRRAPTGHDDKREMTARERDLQRKVEQLQTQVFMLGTIAGIMLSLVGKVGWSHVEQAIYLGLADAAASVPPESEADWDRFMAFIRKQGQAVTVMRPNQAGKADQDTTPTGVVQRGRTNSSSRRNTGMT
jgi:hypothetical protein